uniref:Uncharacterized protein n=1 Tax=Geospiza parvula TaxID=87175 RepID=A0A8U8CAX8_GEOPR
MFVQGLKNACRCLIESCQMSLSVWYLVLSAFWRAGLSDSLMIVISSILTGINIETSFQFGWTPLMCAASVANFAVVRLLLDRGANACFEIDKYTVLMAACTAQASEENILNTVELLLSRNADPNLACRY